MELTEILTLTYFLILTLISTWILTLTLMKSMKSWILTESCRIEMSRIGYEN